MATWVKFKRDFDYRHESRAVTAYKRGDEVYVPKHILENLPADVYEKTDKPGSDATEDSGDGRVFLTDSNG